MKSIIFALSALTLVACSSFEFKTNLDPQNFKEYFKPSAATEVTDADIENKPTHLLGVVEGLSCQVTEDDPVATEANARTDARKKAADLGANAIKFGKCVRLENTPACKVSVSCYANAIAVDDDVEKSK